MEFWASVLPVFVLLVLGFFVGSFRERRHLADLTRRERALANITCNNLKRITHPDQVRGARLVTGEVAIASDYFKTFAANLRNIVGGEVRAFDTLLQRARREAILRMLEEARAMGACEVWNIRLGTSNISSQGRNKAAVSVEVFAYGTAIVRI